MSLMLESVDPKILVEECIQTIELVAAKNGNTLSTICPPDLKPFLGDATKLRQALFNLLSNACKFTEKGSVDLAVQAFEKDAAPWIRFTVRDTGIGLSDVQIDRIFQEFTQAEESTSRRYGGTGLGLALSRKLCQLMGGDISVESQIKQGSSFVIEIPAPLIQTSKPDEQEGLK